MPPKKSLDDQLTFPLKASEKAQLEQDARKFGITKSALMRRIVTSYLANPSRELIMTVDNTAVVVPVPQAQEG